MKNFNEETDLWFYDHKVESKSKAVVLNFIKEKTPTRRNLEKLMEMLYDAELDDIRATAQDIINGEFSHEFRFRYHNGPSDFPGKVSAASAYFSQVRQTLTISE